MARNYPYHYAADALVEADPFTLFAHLDDPSHLSAHMSQSSVQTGGMRMKIEVDGGVVRRSAHEFVYRGA